MNHHPAIERIVNRHFVAGRVGSTLCAWGQAMNEHREFRQRPLGAAGAACRLRAAGETRLALAQELAFIRRGHEAWARELARQARVRHDNPEAWA